MAVLSYWIRKISPQVSLYRYLSSKPRNAVGNHTVDVYFTLRVRRSPFVQVINIRCGFFFCFAVKIDFEHVVQVC